MEKVTPDYVLRLMDLVGPTEAARLLGTAPGVLYKMRRAHAALKWIEDAARDIWNRRHLH